VVTASYGGMAGTGVNVIFAVTNKGEKMIYELEAYNTDCRYSRDVRYRDYTTSKKKADKFNTIPKIQFTDSGHGIVFHASEHAGSRKPRVTILSDYVHKYI
jgi:hypothetical protein